MSPSPCGSARRLSRLSKTPGPVLINPATAPPARASHPSRSPQPPRARIRSVFTVNVEFGTPPQLFDVIVDTGSTLAYVPCSNCGAGCGTHEARTQRSQGPPTPTPTLRSAAPGRSLRASLARAERAIQLPPPPSSVPPSLFPRLPSPSGAPFESVIPTSPSSNGTIEQNHVFDPAKSTTYSAISCASPTCGAFSARCQFGALPPIHQLRSAFPPRLPAFTLSPPGPPSPH